MGHDKTRLLADPAAEELFLDDFEAFLQNEIRPEIKAINRDIAARNVAKREAVKRLGLSVDRCDLLIESGTARLEELRAFNAANSPGSIVGSQINTFGANAIIRTRPSE